MKAQILVVKPKSLNAADKKLLRESGVVVVESNDPASVRLLGCEPQPMNSTDLFYAAMKAIASDKYAGNTADHFAKQVAALTKASSNLGPELRHGE